MLSPSPQRPAKPHLQTKALLFTALLLLGFLPSLLHADEAVQAPPRLRRADSFLGIHFDFHAGPNATEVGKNTRPEMIETIIREVAPDYIQIDCKGHKGFSSYPTKVGNPAPGFVGDPLRVWRETTARHGIALYMHYSGVWDSKAIEQHPEWATVNADGSRDPNAISPFSAYDDQLLIPQLKELAETYQVDGAWVDGECWVARPDYGAAAAAAFSKITPLDSLPRNASDPYWQDFLEFNREAFRQHVRHYITALKSTHPDFQLCSNWAYSDYMAEAPTLPLDFLSGDLAPEDSVNSARLSARYLAEQGKPWDLMAWSFVRKPAPDGRWLKSALQLKREAAIVIALGGGYQTYFRQKRDGSIFLEQMPLAGEIARFARARQAYSHGAVPIPQIALLLSTPGHYRRTQALFQRDLAPVSGLLEALIETQLAVNVVSEHHLLGHLSDWPLIIIPEWDYLEPSFRDELITYVEKGGRLLLIGPGPLALFDAALSQPVPTANKSLLYRHGLGLIAALPTKAGSDYQNTHAPALRTQLATLIHPLFPQPLASLENAPGLELIPMRHKGSLIIHLINVSGPHRTQDLIDQIEATPSARLTIRVPHRPKNLLLLPEARPLPFTYENGVLTTTIPPIEIDAAIQVLN